ncbi:MAG TPA: hypothetical protein VHQ24_01615 [Lachnospiraceae bacterium]|nr:hypothetical protein [Lachnospiraceae bacterium]
MQQNVKKQIDFARTYRHLSINKLETTLYLLFFVLPIVVLLFFFYSELTYGITQLSGRILDGVIPVNLNDIGSSVLLHMFGNVYFLKLPNVLPEENFIIINLVVSLVILAVCMTGRRAGHPMSIFFIMILLTHVSSCLYFLFFSDHFPYTASEYSDLYMKQEVSIWISFAIIAGLVTAFLGLKGIWGRMVTMTTIMVYSFIFGIVRYIFFLYVIYSFSNLYMAVLFFIFGPLFDFLYFVFFYGIYIDKAIKRYDSKKGREQWGWA